MNRQHLALVCLLVLLACRTPPKSAPAKAVQPTLVPTLAPVTFGQVWGTEPMAEESLALVVARVVQAASTGEPNALEPWVSEPALARMALGRKPGGPLPVMPSMVTRRLAGGRVQRVVYEGGRATVLVAHGSKLTPTYFYLEHGHWRLDPIDMSPYIDPIAGTADPDNHALSLDEATAGLAGDGTLTAEIETTVGTLHCSLATELAPRTVANFVGLARGLRAVGVGPDAKPLAKFARRPFYDGLPVHRTVTGVLAETGDPSGKGGHAGYTIADEFSLHLRHDRPGVLAMASRGPHTGSSAFYVTAKPAPWLDDRHAIFGQCRDLDVIQQLAQTKPNEVTVRTVRVHR